jgi:hypothetical protein
LLVVMSAKRLENPLRSGDAVTITRSSPGGSRNPVVERHAQAEIRAIVSPLPSAEVVRSSYRPG